MVRTRRRDNGDGLAAMTNKAIRYIEASSYFDQCFIYSEVIDDKPLGNDRDHINLPKKKGILKV